MYRPSSIVVCAGVAVLASALGACGSGSTPTSTKPSRGFTGTTAPGKPGAPTVVVNCPTDNLQNALNAAQPGSTIEVHGTCTGHFTINVNNLVVAGVLGRQDALDGGGTGTVLTVNAGVSATFNEINVQHGSTPTGTSGGGIDNYGTLTLYAAKVTGNTAGGGGGGIYNEGSLTVRGSLVTYNTANAEGGGIWNKGTAVLINGDVSNNQANNGANGGGIGNDGTLTLRSAGVDFNTTHGVPCRGFADGCAGIGGGIYNSGPADVPRDSAKFVRDNYRTVPPPQGGQDVNNCEAPDNQHLILYCGG